jgi:hypothetical protein
VVSDVVDETAAGGDYKSVRRQGRKTSKAAELGKIKTSDTHKQFSTSEFDKTVAGVSVVSGVSCLRCRALRACWCQTCRVYGAGRSVLAGVRRVVLAVRGAPCLLVSDVSCLWCRALCLCWCQTCRACGAGRSTLAGVRRVVLAGQSDPCMLVSDL